MIQYKYLPPPWGNCVEKNLPYVGDYGMDSCKMYCLNEYIQKQCGCRLISVPSSKSLILYIKTIQLIYLF